MLAKVFHRSREFFVGLTLDGRDLEEAGPFDDEHEAVMMARRTVGAENVRFSYGVLSFVQPCAEESWATEAA